MADETEHLVEVQEVEIQAEIRNDSDDFNGSYIVRGEPEGTRVQPTCKLTCPFESPSTDMVNIQTTEEQIVSDWITHSEEEGDGLGDFPTPGPEVLITTSTNQNLSDATPRKRKTPGLSSGIHSNFESAAALVPFANRRPSTSLFTKDFCH